MNGKFFVSVLLLAFTISFGVHADGDHGASDGNPGVPKGGGAHTDVLTAPAYARQAAYLSGLRGGGNQVLGYRVYSRGNDDDEETDQAGVSNYQTAQMAVALQTVPSGSDMQLNLAYHFELTTGEVQAVMIAPRFRLGEVANSMKGPSAPMSESQITRNFLARDAQHHITAGSTFSASVNVGNVPFNHDGVYTGEAQVNFAPPGQPFPANPQAGHQQTITWRVEVRNGAIVSSSIDMVQRGTPVRSPEALLHLVGSSDPHDTLVPAHPRKQGQSHGPAEIG